MKESTLKTSQGGNGNSSLFDSASTKKTTTQNDEATVKPSDFPLTRSDDKPYTPYWAAKRFTHQNRDKIRYCKKWDKWLTWSGKHWEIDETEEIMRLVKESVNTIYTDAVKLSDSGIEKQLKGFALSCERENKMQEIIKLARSENPIAAKPDTFDQNNWLINLNNGILDLKKMELLQSDPSYNLTKIAPVEYIPGSDAPQFTQFLERIFQNDMELIEYVQCAVGYSLTGSNREQCFFILYGRGANGKSTFLNIISEMLGDYSKQTATQTLMKKSNDTIPNDIAALNGARFVTAQETNRDRSFDEALIKNITGGDPVTARFLHREYFEYVPQYKIWLSTNNKPEIVGTDEGIWRRVRLIPFETTIPKDEQDQELLNKLRGELPGILTWAAKGCRKWRENGLKEPKAVRLATQEYRNEMDIVGTYIDERCVKQNETKVLYSDLYQDFENWCCDESLNPLSMKQFSTRLSEKGYARKRNGGKHYRYGIKLVDNGVKSH